MSDEFEIDSIGSDEVIAEIYVHMIFWTRRLAPALSPEALARARETMDQALFPIEGEALAAGGGPEHLHILARLSPEHSVQEALDVLRGQLEASVAEPGGETGPIWHEEDVVVSVNPCDLDQARRFIEDQRSHHEAVSVQSEMKAVFDEYNFEYDEQQLWG